MSFFKSIRRKVHLADLVKTSKANAGCQTEPMPATGPLQVLKFFEEMTALKVDSVVGNVFECTMEGFGKGTLH
jgi:hypothetical protein